MMDARPPEEDLSALERARERLYAPAGEPSEIPEALGAATPAILPARWKQALAPGPIGTKRHIRFASRFFLGALGFFFLAIAAAAILFYTGTNTVSVDNVAIGIQGPTTIAGGDTVPLSITITNKNPVAIDNATLEIDFPEGTRSATDVTEAYPRYSEDLGTIASGATLERSVKAVLFGGQGSAVTIPVSLSYGTNNSNATFVKRTAYPVTISTAPLSVSLDTVSETVSGQPLTVTATVRSNASAPVADVVLSPQYPAGFSLTSSSIPPIGSNFVLGTLKPGEVKTITLTGTLTGQNNDLRAFHFTVGTGKGANDPALSVAYMTQEADVTLAAPFLATAIAVNGSSDASPVVAPGSPVSVSVSWTNTLSVPVQNADIEVALSGAALDPASVKSNTGFYRSSDETVLFNKDTDQTLASLAPGATGIGTFTFNTLSGGSARGASITLTLSISGDRLGEAGVPTSVSASLAKVIKVASAVSFTASALHSSGPLPNAGPIPPVANQETSYTVLWNIQNVGNDLAGASVKATLPSYVTFSGRASPADGSISFDPSSRTVTWSAGDISAGGARQGAFTVVLTPSTSQRGTEPALTSTPTLSAFDRFAQVNITTQGLPVTTQTPGDPGYTAADSIVQ